MKVTTAVAGIPIFTLGWDGAPDITPGMIPGITAAGAAPGITADGTIPGSMVTEVTDGTVPGITAAGTVLGIVRGTPVLEVITGMVTEVITGVVTLTASMMVITAV
jgi:hypothetical protein